MTLLVTGGLGFIGSNFIVYYLNSHPDEEIVNLDSVTYAASPIATEELRRYRKYKLVKGSINDLSLVLNITKSIETIVHFAAETHVDRSIENPTIFASTNIIGTLNLLEAARMNKVTRFHHISTDEVFGSLELNSKEKFNENTRYNPRNPYSASKAASDFYVRAYHEIYGLNTTITNCSNNFGPYQHREKLIPRIIFNLMLNKPAPIYGDGENVRDWLYVEDHCAAIDLALSRGRPGESYCVSAGNEFSNLEVAHMIVEIIGKGRKLIQFVADRPGHDKRYALDARKIRSELGWNPKNDFRESLVRTVAWYREHRNRFQTEV